MVQETSKYTLDSPIVNLAQALIKDLKSAEKYQEKDSDGKTKVITQGPGTNVAMRAAPTSNWNLQSLNGDKKKSLPMDEIVNYSMSEDVRPSFRKRPAPAPECNVSYQINFNNGVSAAPAQPRFATGMNGDEDLGQDIALKGNKFRYRAAGIDTSHFDSSNVDKGKFKNLVTDKPSPITMKLRGPSSFAPPKPSPLILANMYMGYHRERSNEDDCSINESDNWKGAQQCSYDWECKGARTCERGGWCAGYDGCEGTHTQTQAPGLATDN